MSQTTVIVPAAGSGTRMGGVPKQFRMLGGAPVLVQTLRAFRGHRLVVPVSAGEVEVVEALLGAYDVEAKVVVGGATRQDSVAAGLAAVPDGTEVVLVHDAVRPFLAAEKLDAVIEAIRSEGAAALAVPVADTLRQGQDGLFGETVDRDGLWRMQTPQGAQLDVFREAHRQAQDGTFLATDEVGVLQQAGYTVTLVEGDARNLKLTHPADWALAEALWPSWASDEGGWG